MADTGNGASVAFDTLETNFAVRNIDPGESTVEPIDASLLSSTGHKEYVFGDLAETPDISFEVVFNATDTLPEAGDKDTITVTFPQASGESAPATFSGTGAFTSVPLPVMENDNLMTMTLTFKMDGGTGPTYTPATTE